MLPGFGRGCASSSRPERLDRDTARGARPARRAAGRGEVRAGLRRGGGAAPGAARARQPGGRARAAARRPRPAPGSTRSRRTSAYALRLLRRRPAFTAACLLTVALGVGASTALFAVVDAVVLRPLPLPEPGALVAIYDSNAAQGVDRTGITSGNLVDWRRRTRAVPRHRRPLHDGPHAHARQRVRGGALGAGDRGLLRGARACRRRSAARSRRRRPASRSSTTRPRPSRRDPVVVLGHALWQRRFGSDPARGRARRSRRAAADARSSA